MFGGNGQIINPELDQGALKLELATEGFVEIPKFLKSDVADQVFNCLDKEVSWEFAYKNGAEAVTKSFEELRELSPDEKQEFHGQVIEQAKHAYQFAYFRYPMVDAYLNNWTPRLMLNDVMDSMNNKITLEFIRDITSDPEVRKVELQATFYAPGHFLKLHNDDSKSGDDRRYAFLIGFTKDWVSDWGGLLQFVSEGKVTRTCTPSFNSCVIFKVPRDHQVSYIAPYVTLPRYSLTGWLRAD